MNVTYRNNKIKKKLSNSSEINKAFGKMAKKVSQRMEEIRSAANLKVLQQLPAANCHPLSGDRNEHWAVDISGNFRLIFDLNHDPIPKTEDGDINAIIITDVTIIETTDYH